MINIINKFKKKINKKETIEEYEMIKYIPSYDYELCLNRLENEKDISTIPILFWTLLLKNNYVKKQFVKVMSEMFREFSGRQYTTLGNIFRERRDVQRSWAIMWNKIETGLVLESCMTEEEKLTVIGLCTFHPNGHFREKALKALIEMKIPNSFPFVAVRTYDWVYDVRCIAEDALEEMINSESIKSVILNIEIIDKIKNNINLLKNYYRYESYRLENIGHSEEKLKSIYLKIDKILDNNPSEALKYLKEAAYGKNPYVSEYAVNKIIEKKYMSLSEVMELIASIKCNNSIKLKNLRALFDKCSKEEIIDNRELLESIKGSKTEELVMDKFYEYGLYENAEELEKAALSRYAVVRESARFYMKKLGRDDLYEFYKSKVDEEKYALLGLCETCTEENIKFVTSYFSSVSSKTKKKMIKKVMDLSEYGVYYDYEMFMQGIKSGNSGVIKLCREYISKNYEMFEEEEIYKIYMQGKEKSAREAAASILCLGNSWTALIYILKFISEEEREISKAAFDNLKRWLSEKEYYLVNEENGGYSHYLLHKMNENDSAEIKKIFNKNSGLLKKSDRIIISGLIAYYSA